MVPVESKTVKFDVIVQLRDGTFTPAAMQSATTYKFKEIPHNHLTAQRGVPNVISWPYYPAGGNWRTRFLHYYTCSRAWITSLLYRDGPWLKTIINTTGCMPTAGKTAVFNADSTSKQTILQGKFLHSLF